MQPPPEENPFEAPQAPVPPREQQPRGSKNVRPTIAWTILGALFLSGVMSTLIMSTDPISRLVGGFVVGALPGGLIGYFVGKQMPIE